MGFFAWLRGMGDKKPIERHGHNEIRSWEGDGFTWYDVHEPTAKGLARLAEEVGIEEAHLAAAAQRNQMSLLQHYDDCAYLSVHFPIMDQASERVVAIETILVFGKDFIMTIHNMSHREVVDSLFDRYKRGDLDVVPVKTVGRLLQVILEELQRESHALISDIFYELDEIEDRVFDTSGSEAKMIGQLRRKIVRMRFILGAQRVVLEDLPQEMAHWGGEKLAVSFGAIPKTNKRMSESLDEAGQTIEIYKDADYIISSERTNSTMAILTLMFTLAIPVTLVAGIYGMNVYLPGGIEYEAWTFWGPYTTLMVMLMASVVASALMFAYLKWKKWF